MTIKRDGTAPLTDRVDVVDATWRNSPRAEQFSASDAMSGLADPDDASFTLTASDESAGALVPTVVEKAVVDKSGNTSTRRVTALIDMSSPVVVDAGTTATPNAAGWHRSAITNTFTASDALSGLAAASSASQDVSTASLEGRAVTVSSEAVNDVAGNTTGGIVSKPFKIDLTPPTVALIGAADGASIWTAEADVGCAGDDALSGVASCLVTGSTSPEGTRTLTATATDNAGNTAVVSRTFTAIAQAAADVDPPAEQRLPVTGIATGLLALWGLIAVAAGIGLLLPARRVRPC